MKTLKFKCTLLSDVILNTRSASTGPNETLDFIPGSNFLGIAAAKLYADLSSEETSLIFHSGKVRFGDAHPSLGRVRGLKVPASLFYPKLSSPEKELYVHHLIPENADMGTKQLKQCRQGFYVFSAVNDKEGDGEKMYEGTLVKTDTSFALKSAYDRSERRSKDSQLFGYQSLRKGLEMYFSVEADDDVVVDLLNKVGDALVKGNRIGRSRSAQYGLVKIERVNDFSEIRGDGAAGVGQERLVAVYADSRLIFLDEYGMPTFCPTAEQLGLKGDVLWDKSQIRTFRYAPWNFKRQCFDTDRCGIEKGSVLVVSVDPKFDPGADAQYVGSYRNEGFGRVIYNPPILAANNNGEASCRLITDDAKRKVEELESSPKTDTHPLIAYLRNRKEEEEGFGKVFEMVNEWVNANAKNYQKGDFASQWGTIRSMAVSSLAFDSLIEDLFSTPEGYLMHGIAKKKWEVKRLENFKGFAEALKNDGKLTDAMKRLAIVNLASEMGKKCR